MESFQGLGGHEGEDFRGQQNIILTDLKAAQL
jgi:hypothetical protein